jgi:metal-responsive CopG/Arc/MetJ family transcriptional regulator
MIVSAEVPDELIQELDIRIAKERLTAAVVRSKGGSAVTPSRSSLIKEALQHFLLCNNALKK